MRLALHAVAAVAVFASPAFAKEVALRPAIVASGPAVTLGDFFEDAGEAGGRAVGPAPRAGRTSTFSARFVQAAANAAGLTWTPPDGVTAISVAGAGADTNPAVRTGIVRTSASGEIAIRRNEIVALTYRAPGIRLVARARAMSDASVGDAVRLVNLQSNRVVDATVTGPGAASASAFTQD